MERPTTIGFADVQDMLRRHWYLMTWLALPVIVVSCGLAVSLPDVYRSTAVFELKQDAVSDRTTQARGEYADRFITGIKDKVLNPDNRAKIVAELSPYAKQGLSPEDAADQLDDDVGLDMITETVLDPLSSRQRDIYTGFLLSYENRDAETAHAVTQWLANAFLAESRQFKADEAAKSSKFLADQVERARADIADHEAALADFKKQNFGRLPELAQANVNAMERTETDLHGVQQELYALRQNRQFVVGRLEELEQQSPDAQNLRELEDEYKRKVSMYSEDHPDVIALRRQIDSIRSGQSGTPSSPQQELANQRAILAEARRRYSDDHPDVKRIMRRIQDLEAQVAAGGYAPSNSDDFTPAHLQLQTQLKAIDTQIAGLEAQESDLRQRRGEFESRLTSTPEVEKDYQRVVRGLEGARSQYDALLRQKMDADFLAAGVMQGRADLFELAGAPNLPSDPAQPHRLRILLLGLIIAGVFAVAGAIGAEVLGTTVRGSSDVQSFSGSAPLGVIPVIRNAEFVRRRRRQLGAIAGFVGICLPLVFVIVHFALT